MKRIQETYNMFMILSASIVLNAVIIGAVIVLPLYIFVGPVICE